MQRGFEQNEVRVKESPPSSPNSSSSSSSSCSSSSDSAPAFDTSRLNFPVPSVSRFVGDGFFEEKPKIVGFGERLIDETIDRRKFLRPTIAAPSSISASVATDNAFPRALNNQVIQSQPGFSGGQAECSPVLPRVTNSSGPEPVENPFIFPCFPYNKICVSSATTPSLKRKSEDFVNSCDPTHMESLFRQVPGGISQNSVLHAGFVPVQALFQNSPLPAAVRVQPVDYSLTPSLSFATRNQELNFFAASRSQLNGNSLSGNASEMMHKQKVVRPRLTSSTSAVVVSDGKRNANSEPSGKNAYSFMPEHKASEATSKPFRDSTHSELSLGYLPSASSYRPEDDKGFVGDISYATSCLAEEEYN